MAAAIAASTYAVSAVDLRKIEWHLHLECNKWDTLVGDVSVLSEHALILSRGEWDLLCCYAEQLAAETAALELFALRKALAKPRCPQARVGGSPT